MIQLPRVEELLLEQARARVEKRTRELAIAAANLQVAESSLLVAEGGAAVALEGGDPVEISAAVDAVEDASRARLLARLAAASARESLGAAEEGLARLAAFSGIPEPTAGRAYVLLPDPRLTVLGAVLEEVQNTPVVDPHVSRTFGRPGRGTQRGEGSPSSPRHVLSDRLAQASEETCGSALSKAGR